MSFADMREKTSAKAELRSEIRSTLKKLSLGDRISESREIRNRLAFSPGSKIALFAGTQSEVQLLELLERTKDIEWFLPRVSEDSKMDFLPANSSDQLVKGPFGIMEPSHGNSARDLDAIVCPGIAFTREGKRLGQGGGFYDRALAKFPTAKLIGVCYQCQLLDDIPTEDHDIKMSQVITARQEFLAEK